MIIDQYDTYLFESCRCIEDLSTITDEYDLFISGFNKEDMVRQVFFHIKADKKIWLLFPDYNLEEKDIEGVKPFIEEWVRRDFVPEEYNFVYKPEKAKGIVKELLCEKIKEGMDALEIHNAVYEFSKEKGVNARELFKECYKTLIGKERGPRLGKLIYALGVEKVKKDVC